MPISALAIHWKICSQGAHKGASKYFQEGSSTHYRENREYGRGVYVQSEPLKAGPDCET